MLRNAAIFTDYMVLLSENKTCADSEQLGYYTRR